jgi:hypothetical protein
MKINDLVAEGTFVVKSKDGVEKRFKSATSPEALEWKEKTVRKPRAASPSKEETAVRVNSAIHSAVLRVGTWGELDRADILMRTIVPFLYTEIGKYDYPEKFEDAVAKAKRGDGFLLLPFLDAYAKTQGEKDWNAFCDQYESHGGVNESVDDTHYPAEPMYYIVRIKDDAVSAGPFETRAKARQNTQFYRWYNPREYDVCYGTVNDDDIFIDATEPPQPGLRDFRISDYKNK